MEEEKIILSLDKTQHTDKEKTLGIPTIDEGEGELSDCDAEEASAQPLDRIEDEANKESSLISYLNFSKELPEKER
jgi:hypothetical protein